MEGELGGVLKENQRQANSSDTAEEERLRYQMNMRMKPPRSCTLVFLCESL